ncbi:hypothetical protein HA402_013162 [Bradysia odoriphaga]|nr:hypothetical protein HA402_013162 [Bradysia odoriphaga]
MLHIRGHKYSFIAKELNRHPDTISTVIKKWKDGIFHKPKARLLRRTKLSAQQTLNVLKYFIQNPFHTYDQCVKKLNLPIHKRTVGNILTRHKFGNYVACTKQFISLQNQIRRLRFALTYRHWTNEWLNVLFMDEKTVQTYNNAKILVKRLKKERYDPSKMKTDERQNTKNKVNLFGVVSYNGPNTIYSVSTKLNGTEVKQLMRKNIKRDIGNSVVLLDNASIHNKCIEYLRKKEIIVLDFPPKSNDLNIIENVWAELQKNLNKKLLNFTVSTKNELLQLIEESWKELPSDFIRKCILSMPERLEEVIKMKGKQTRF